jgi:hypothetical protein
MSWSDIQTLSTKIQPPDWNDMVSAINTKALSAYFDGPAGTSSKNILKIRFPVSVKIKRIYVTSLIAPGATYITTITLTDTVSDINVILSDTQTFAQNESLSQDYAANTYLYINIVDSNSLATTAKINVTVFYEVV